MSLFLLSIFNSKIYSEEKPLFPFNWVNVPDSISTLLAKEYMIGNCNAEHNVRNMTIRNDVEFQPGVYVYNGMGPHFEHKMFIYKNDIYVFGQTIENANLADMLSELAICRDSLKLSEVETDTYKKVIHTAIVEHKLYVEDPLDKKVKMHKPYPTNVVKGKWHIQIKLTKRKRAKRWTRIYGCSLNLRNSLNGNVSVEMDCVNNKENAQEESSAIGNENNTFKIIEMYKSRRKYYMVINRKIGKREYETYYLSKTYGSPVKTCGLGIDFR